ncbi:MAG: hypothetical protein K2N05_03905 [Muribaculaceae bacterium]|nr:hypothetical protein [Muribaculaceae bacterium]
MKRLILFATLLAFILSPVVTHAQELKVTSMEIKPLDLTARTNPRVDRSGQMCALLKVQVMDDIVEAQGNVMGDIINKEVEKWIYVSDHTKQIRLLFKNHFPLMITFNDHGYPTVSEQMVYEIKLTDATPTKASSSGQGNHVALTSNKHEKRKLYTFGEGERMYDNEYLSSRKFGSGNWMMITQSPSGWKLIKNGKAIVSDAEWIDLFGYDAASNTAVYCYRNNADEIYAHVDGSDLGPFTKLWNFYGNLENPMKVAFMYNKMGMWFYRDYNGKSYNLGDVENPDNGDSRIIYTSLNGLHTLRFSSDKKSITVDGRRIELIPASNNSPYIREVYVYNNGDWYVEGSLQNNEGYWTEIKKGSVNGKIKDLTGTDSAVHPQKGIMGYEEATNTDAMKKNRQLWYRPFGRNWNEKEEKLEVKTQFLINGRTTDDEFISNWQYDYVMINNKKVGTAAALDAWYDPTMNAFVWITIDGDDLVENAYKL